MWLLNNVWLNDPNDNVYQVIHNGKEYQYARVTSVLESTIATPFQLKRWMVNCGVDAILDSKDATNNLLDRTECRKIGWEAHQIESKRALAIGSEVHKAIQHPGMLSMQYAESLQALKAYGTFSLKYQPQSMAQEVTLYDHTLKIAGTIDWLGMLNGTPDVWILDWKTSKSVSHGYLVQLAIYKKMFLTFLKAYKKTPANYSTTIQSVMSRLISHTKLKSANPKIRIAVVRLDKHIPVRKTTEPKYEFVEVTRDVEKVCLEEFKLALKLFNYRKDHKCTN
jgi:hypothetical protein